MKHIISSQFRTYLKKMKFSTAISLIALASPACSFVISPAGVRNNVSLKMSLEKYADELKATAAAMVRPGHGLLACDESTGTVGSRLESIGMENSEDNRRDVS